MILPCRSQLDKRFNIDYTRYHDLISKITTYNFLVEDDINYISFLDIMRSNERNISLNEILISGFTSLSNNQKNLCKIAKLSTIAFIYKYWKPLIDLCYKYVFDEDFRSYKLYSNEYNLIFIPTKINRVYSLRDEYNNIIYTNDIYDCKIKSLYIDTGAYEIIN